MPEITWPTNLVVYDDNTSDRYVVVRGMLRDWLIRHRQPAMYGAIVHGWWVRRDRIDEIVSLAELDHIPVKIVQGRSAA